MKKTFFIALALIGAGFLAKPSDVKASTVTIEKGDTLWAYSKKYDVTIDEIAKENAFSLNSYMMWPGDKINIPDGKDNEDGAKFTNRFVASITKPQAITTYQQKAAAVGHTAQPQTTPSTQPQTTTGTSYGSFKVTFYDPAVLGASTMPGGMYSGVAANLSVFPKGTRLKIAMSNGQTIYRTVNDTGGFANMAGGSRWLDVAWPNAQIPSAGVLSAQVTVLN